MRLRAAPYFLLEHGAEASGVTWREATKYLPPAMKRQVERARVSRA